VYFWGMKLMLISKKSNDKCPFKPLHGHYRLAIGEKAPCPRTYSQDYMKGACNESGKKTIELFISAAAFALDLLRNNRKNR
jgi:hypothetical protein